jgi:hypothetical protein
MSERREAVKAETFVAEYKKAVKTGMTNAELGAVLGMPADQVSMRASQLRKRLKAEYNVTLPNLKRAVPQRKKTTELMEDLAEFCKPETE